MEFEATIQERTIKVSGYSYKQLYLFIAKRVAIKLSKGKKVLVDIKVDE